MESDEFETAWVEANRQAHTQLVAVLTGKDTDMVEISNNAVSINLASVIDTVKQRLIERGFTLAERCPRSTPSSRSSSPTTSPRPRARSASWAP